MFSMLTRRLRNLWWPEVCFKAVLTIQSQGTITLRPCFCSYIFQYCHLNIETRIHDLPTGFVFIFPFPGKTQLLNLDKEDDCSMLVFLCILV